MPVLKRSSVDRWTIIRRRDWPQDHGSLVPHGAPVPDPDDLLEVIEVVPVTEVERLREALDAFIKATVNATLNAS